MLTFLKNNKIYSTFKGFLKKISQIEAGHVLKMFLKKCQISASCSYKLGSYKRKKVYVSLDLALIGTFHL